MRKQKSGAEKRKIAKEKRERALQGTTAQPAAAPQVDAAPEFLACYRATEAASDVYDEAIGFLRVAMRLSVEAADAAAGSALERTARIAASLVKAVDPKRQIEELGAELRAAAKDIAELEERVSGASRQSPRGSSEPPGPPIN